MQHINTENLKFIIGNSYFPNFKFNFTYFFQYIYI